MPPSTTMRNYTYTIRVHPPDEQNPGYWVDVPALPGCFTQCTTYADAVANVQEAITGFLEALVKAGQPIPQEEQRLAEVTAVVRVEAGTPV